MTDWSILEAVFVDTSSNSLDANKETIHTEIS